jgi:hypothetical protein
MESWEGPTAGLYGFGEKKISWPSKETVTIRKHDWHSLASCVHFMQQYINLCSGEDRIY